MTDIHLPEDIGDRPSKLGAKPSSQSYSIVLASNNALLTYEVEPTTSSTDIVARSPSELSNDLLGMKRFVQTSLLFRGTSIYDLESSQWAFTTADSSTGDSTESVFWTGRVNVRATYPGTTPSVRYSVTESAARLQCLPFSPTSGSGLQQALLFSKRVFAPSMGAPIFITIAVKMSLSLSPNIKKQWGWFNGNSGYFFQIKADGSGDNFSIVRRSNFGGITEEEIPRSAFNGNKLTSLDFTNITMFGIEVGVGSGYHARFWAFILGKWVVVHSLNRGAGTLQNPAINEVALPIAFSISNNSTSNNTETLVRYGTSVSSLGKTIEDNVPNEVSVSKSLTATPGTAWVLLGIRLRQDINNIQNSNTLLPSFVRAFSGNKLASFFLLKNPEVDTSLVWTSVPSSGIEFNTSRLSAFTGGQRIVLAAPASSGVSINLSDLFSVQRDFGSVQYSNDVQLTTDTGFQAPVNQDTYWLCVSYIGLREILLENDLPWDTSTAINTTITSNGSINPYINYVQKATFNVTASLSFLEV